MIRVALIGTGGIAGGRGGANLKSVGGETIVALCDVNPAALERAAQATGVTKTTTDPFAIAKDDAVDAIVIATPNRVHHDIALAALATGKHVLCEKPIAMDTAEALAMWRASEQAQVRHMTAFTYRFVPAMRYMAQLVAQGAVGVPYHFRAHRLQDWGTRNLGWRQQKRFAATGEIGDMLSHRIDYGHLLVGPLAGLVAKTTQLVDVRDGHPADVDDWVALLAEFRQGSTGVLESSKLATGCGEGKDSPDHCEVNGTEGTVVYQLSKPHEILRASKNDRGLKTEPVPREFLTWPGSNRDPFSGDPLMGFRCDQDVEFLQAILEGRPCTPSFAEGVAVQAVIDAALASADGRTWVDVAYPVL